VNALLAAASGVDARTVPLEHFPLPAEQVVEGRPTTGEAVLARVAGAEVGVWEITAGVATDVEADETFLVLAGAATVEFAAGQPPLVLAPGFVGRLGPGLRTRWTVTETLRKLYVVA
jgi:uncharacterized cupin superfamily protein